MVGPIVRAEQPLTFWVVTLLWVALGVMTVMIDLTPQTLEDLYLWMWGY